MTRQNGLVIVTISFYIMYGYLGMPGQGAFAIPYLLNEAVLAIVCAVMVFYNWKQRGLALHLSLLSLSALSVSPFFLEIIMPQGNLIRLFDRGWFEVLKLLHYILICSLMIVVIVRQSKGVQQILGISGIALFIAGVSLGIAWIFLPVYGLMVAAAFTKEGENRTVPLWIIISFMELTKVIAMLLS